MLSIFRKEATAPVEPEPVALTPLRLAISRRMQQVERAAPENPMIRMGLTMVATYLGQLSERDLVDMVDALYAEAEAMWLIAHDANDPNARDAT